MRRLLPIEQTQIPVAQFTRAFHLGGTEGQLVEILRGLSPRYKVRLSALEAAGPLLESLRELGFQPRAFPLGGSFLRLRTVRQTLQLASWLREEQTELVHAHDFYATLVAVPAARVAGVKVIVSRLDLAHWHGRARRAALALATRAADHVVVNADAIRDQLLSQELLPRERVTVIRNGIDLDRFDRRMAQALEAPLPEPGTALVVVHVANMNHPVKRQEDLLEAIAGLPAEADLQVWLIGDGPRRSALERRAAVLGVGARVHFLGRRHDVPAILARAHIGVLCSSAEGLSNAVIEGMAARLPMVVTRVGGNPELIAHLQRGWVVEALQPSALRHALVVLARSPALRQRFGASAREHVSLALTHTRMVRAFEQLYANVLAVERVPRLRGALGVGRFTHLGRPHLPHAPDRRPRAADPARAPGDGPCLAPRK